MLQSYSPPSWVCLCPASATLLLAIRGHTLRPQSRLGGFVPGPLDTATPLLLTLPPHLTQKALWGGLPHFLVPFPVGNHLLDDRRDLLEQGTSWPRICGNFLLPAASKMTMTDISALSAARVHSCVPRVNEWVNFGFSDFFFNMTFSSLGIVFLSLHQVFFFVAPTSGSVGG